MFCVYCTLSLQLSWILQLWVLSSHAGSFAAAGASFFICNDGYLQLDLQAIDNL